MRSIDFGIGFDLRPNGGFILDIREPDHKFIGLIMMASHGQGYTVCPYVLRTLEFRKEVPTNMRSPLKVQEWVIEHVIGWKPREYTILNPIIGLLDTLPRLVCKVQNSKFLMILTHYFIAIALIGYYPFEVSIPSISAKVAGLFFAGLAIFNTVGYREDPFR